MSFEEILDLTTEVFFSFFIVITPRELIERPAVSAFLLFFFFDANHVNHRLID